MNKNLPNRRERGGERDRVREKEGGREKKAVNTLLVLKKKNCQMIMCEQTKLFLCLRVGL